MNISGNTIFIPGATSGIGLALALRLQKRGNTVIIGGRRTAVLAELAEAHGFDTQQLDVADAASIRGAAQAVLARHPQLNVVVAMAGMMRVEDWRSPDTFLDDAEAVITTNLLGPIRLFAAFVEHLRSTPNAAFVTVSSGLAHTPLRVTPSYNASKAAIHMLSETLRLQLAGTGVALHEIVPPAVKTELLPGQSDSDFAMPLDQFADEVMQILETQPDVREVLVDGVSFLRFPEVRGDYEQTVATLNQLDPHAAA